MERSCTSINKVAQQQTKKEMERNFEKAEEAVVAAGAPTRVDKIPIMSTLVGGKVDNICAGAKKIIAGAPTRTAQRNMRSSVTKTYHVHTDGGKLENSSVGAKTITVGAPKCPVNSETRRCGSAKMTT